MTWTPDSEREEEDPPVEYGLVMPFLDQSREFTLGFEVGAIYARMDHGPRRSFTTQVHTENAGQLRLVGKSQGWSVQLEPLNEDWSTMHATYPARP